MLDSFEPAMRIVVVGATGGLGSALVRELSINDCVRDVYALARRETRYSSPKVRFIQCDTNDEETVHSAANKIGSPLDLVINATGLLHDQADDRIAPEKTWRTFQTQNAEEIFRVNAFGPMLVAKHFVPLLRRDAKSVFAAISARVGSISDNQMGGWYSYRASKAALNQFIKCTSIELSRKNKNGLCIALHPGTVDTNLSKPFQGNVAEGKLFSPQFSAQSMLKVINGLKIQDSGNLFAWDGQYIAP